VIVGSFWVGFVVIEKKTSILAHALAMFKTDTVGVEIERHIKEHALLKLQKGFILL